jgi:hypothetical protein
MQHLTPVNELKKCWEWTALEQRKALLPSKALRCVKAVELGAGYSGQASVVPV